MKKTFSIMFALFLMLSPLTVRAEDKNIAEVASGDPQFSILVEALDKADLVDTLTGEGPFTVFAPANEAFEALLEDLDITAEELLAREDLKDILLYHVVAGKVMSTDLTDGMMPKTVNGATLNVDLSDGVMINESKVTTADLEASNGIIHVVDKVLLPPEETEDAKNIVDIAVADDQFSILVTALTKAGLVDTLKGDGPFTVFAPTNAAFEALLKDLGITVDQLLVREDLKDILLYHVVAGKVMSTDLTDGMMPKTVQGTTVKVDLSDGVMINESKVTKADIEASNGVIHVIDKVLVPAGDDAVTTPGSSDELPSTGAASFLPIASLIAVSGAGLLVFKKKK